MKHLHKLLAVVIIAVLFMSVFSAALTPATVTASVSTNTVSVASNGFDKVFFPICPTPDSCIVHNEVAWNS